MRSVVRGITATKYRRGVALAMPTRMAAVRRFSGSRFLVPTVFPRLFLLLVPMHTLLESVATLASRGPGSTAHESRVRDAFDISPAQIDAALTLFGPNQRGTSDALAMTARQAEFVLSRSARTVATGRAGTGKSLTLARRALMLHHVLGHDIDRICILAPTRSLRDGLVDTLASETHRTGLPLACPGTNASSVRSIESKALELARDLLEPGMRVFELLGTRSERTTRNACDATGLTPAETAANGLPRYADISDAQRAWLNTVLTHHAIANQAFADALDTLRAASMTSTPLAHDHPDVIEACTRLDDVEREDAVFCERIERDWRSVGLWPIAGIDTTEANGDRPSIEIDGRRLRAHGWIASMQIFVFLGTRSRIREQRLDSTDLASPTLSQVNWTRSRVVMGRARERVLFVNTVTQLQQLAQQIKHLSAQRLKGTPGFMMVAPGERALKPIVDVLFETGRFAEHLGLDPRKIAARHTTPVAADIGPMTVDHAARTLIDATASWFTAVYDAFDHDGIESSNRLLVKLATPGAWLERIAPERLRTVQHLMVDHGEHLSTLDVNWMRAMHAQLAASADPADLPSLHMVGDSSQGGFASSGANVEHLLRFAERHGLQRHDRVAADDDADAAPHVATLDANAIRAGLRFDACFRSGPRILACANRLVETVVSAGRASLAQTTSDPRWPVMCVDHCVPAQAVDIVRALRNEWVHPATDVPNREHTTRTRNVLVLAGTYEDPALVALRKAFSISVPGWITFATYAEMASHTADAVLMLGDFGPAGPQAHRETLSTLAQTAHRYEAIEHDDALRSAYTALTRARAMAIWLCDPYTLGAFNRMPRPAKLCIKTDAAGVIERIQSQRY